MLFLQRNLNPLGDGGLALTSDVLEKKALGASGLVLTSWIVYFSQVIMKPKGMLSILCPLWMLWCESLPLVHLWLWLWLFISKCSYAFFFYPYNVILLLLFDLSMDIFLVGSPSIYYLFSSHTLCL